ncbi:Cof-type HAD-IIB family hydrolase [Paenibacillus tuaregi]|uniref:Cof-type HAD-IIB family hydrolase n=1 Tax=Paenibacillus tuaregi TaxID=1816681 RepID=UPI0008392E62|nr:Cof-type HAD-IIB family hydrolase [Paenibacillus tuaregi]
MRYKMIFSDIDGTLLNSNHEITPGTKEAVQLLKQKGVPFVLVSARMPVGILPLLEELGMNEPLVCFSGALVLGAAGQNGSREVLHTKAMEPQDVKGIYALISNKFSDISFSAYNKDHWFVLSLDDEWVIQEQEITGTDAQPFNFNHDTPPFIHKLLCMGHPEAIASLETELKIRYPEITIYKSKPTYLEVMASHVLKSSAIDILTRAYGVTREEIIAFGDNYNDIDMLQFAGLGVAMGNAPDEVKAAADVITSSNDEDGLKAVLEMYFI